MRKCSLLCLAAFVLAACALGQTAAPAVPAVPATVQPAQNDNAPFVVTAVPPPPTSGRWVGGVEGGQAPLGFVEVHGLSAGPFQPEMWQKNQLNWVPDVRMPVLAPRMGGVFRNIYAPNAVEEGEGWRFFYAAWDGIESGTDRVYGATTPDFIDFYDRQTLIHNGEFVHVSNENVQRAPDGSLQMIATAWAQGRSNWPVYFHSPDGKINVKALQSNIDTLYKQGLIKQTLQVAPNIDHSLVEEAAKRL